MCHGYTLRCFAEVEGLCVVDVLCGVLQKWRACVSCVYFAVFCRSRGLVFLQMSLFQCTLRCFTEVESLCVMDVLCGV